MKDDKMKRHPMLLSELYHSVVFYLKKSRTQFEKGMLIVSVDVDVGNKELGILNRGRNDKNISSNLSEYLIGEIEERALLTFINLFNNFEVPVTFGIRGQLMEVDCSTLILIRDSPVRHDIGAHGYSHKSFTSLSRSEAEEELKKIHDEMEKFNIEPKSFVFPRNNVAHLDLLVKHRYKCYRGPGGFLKDCMRIERRDPLFNVCPSLYISQGLNSDLLKRILDISITRKLPFHIWFHLWNFGQEDKQIQRNVNKILIPMLDYAKRKEQNGVLTFETMLSATRKAEKYLNF
jgi:peptidoglycan/xylan/chitin deacetylase (PgdA/CDA1 family)